jgi:hypothetical protein
LVFKINKMMTVVGPSQKVNLGFCPIEASDYHEQNGCSNQTDCLLSILKGNVISKGQLKQAKQEINHKLNCKQVLSCSTPIIQSYEKLTNITYNKNDDHGYDNRNGKRIGT